MPRPRPALPVHEVPVPDTVFPGQVFRYAIAGHGDVILRAPTKMRGTQAGLGTVRRHTILTLAPPPEVGSVHCRLLRGPSTVVLANGSEHELGFPEQLSGGPEGGSGRGSLPAEAIFLPPHADFLPPPRVGRQGTCDGARMHAGADSVELGLTHAEGMEKGSARAATPRAAASGGAERSNDGEARLHDELARFERSPAALAARRLVTETIGASGRRCQDGYAEQGQEDEDASDSSLDACADGAWMVGRVNASMYRDVLEAALASDSTAAWQVHVHANGSMLASRVADRRRARWLGNALGPAVCDRRFRARQVFGRYLLPDVHMCVSRPRLHSPDCVQESDRSCLVFPPLSKTGRMEAWHVGGGGGASASHDAHQALPALDPGPQSAADGISSGDDSHASSGGARPAQCEATRGHLQSASAAGNEQTRQGRVDAQGGSGGGDAMPGSKRAGEHSAGPRGKRPRRLESCESDRGVLRPCREQPQQQQPVQHAAGSDGQPAEQLPAKDMTELLCKGVLNGASPFEEEGGAGEEEGIGLKLRAQYGRWVAGDCIKCSTLPPSPLALLWLPRCLRKSYRTYLNMSAAAQGGSVEAQRLLADDSHFNVSMLVERIGGSVQQQKRFNGGRLRLRYPLHAAQVSCDSCESSWTRRPWLLDRALNETLEPSTLEWFSQRKLWAHCQEGDVDEIVLALDTLPTSLEERDEDFYGGTALHHAAWHGRADAVQCILDRGCPVSVRDDYNWTALHHACQNGHKEAAKTLLRAGASANEPGGLAQMARYPQELRPLHWAAFMGHGDVVRLLLEHGADVHAKDGDGRSALFLATRWAHAGAVQALLDGGASTRQRCEWSEGSGATLTPAELAERLGLLSQFPSMVPTRQQMPSGAAFEVILLRVRIRPLAQDL